MSAKSVVYQGFNWYWGLNAVIVTFCFYEELADASRLQLRQLSWQHNLGEYFCTGHFDKVFSDVRLVLSLRLQHYDALVVSNYGGLGVVYSRKTFQFQVVSCLQGQQTFA